MLYRVSVSLSFLEKNPMGFQVPFCSCSSEAPIAAVEASVVSERGAVGDGNVN